jgi:hypothetical protein
MQLGSMLEIKCHAEKELICNEMIDQGCDLLLGPNFQLNHVLKPDFWQCDMLMNQHNMPDHIDEVMVDYT